MLASAPCVVLCALLLLPALCQSYGKPRMPAFSVAKSAWHCMRLRTQLGAAV